ncbi:MAG: DUF928 domain-containing protein [Gammaproteobacteria bacterium]|jgi:hypothetical protein
MKTSTVQIRVVALLALTAWLNTSQAADKAVKEEAAAAGKAQDAVPSVAVTPAAEKPGKTDTMPVYVPPRRGAPLARVGGGTRGAGDNRPFVTVITPEHTGLTSTSRPLLFWYLSDDMQTRFEFALIDENGIDPIIEITSDEKMQAGLNSLDLSRHGVTLEPGTSYQWSVALVGEPERRSSDIVSSGMIEYVALNPDQQAELSRGGNEEALQFYAREGYWYDVFSTLSELIESDPDNAELRRQRRALLEQIGLDEVAAAEQ